MSVPHPPSAPSAFPRRFVGAAGLAALLVAVACLAPDRDQLTAADTPKAEAPKEPLVGGLPLFANWPKGNPDAVIVFTGQTWGFLQPCGCSRPQTGGLERRAVFIDQLKKKGWPVAAVDLGDVYPEKPALKKQGELKYVAMMNAMREMGYIATSIGKTELQGDPIAVLFAYSFQKEQRPFVLSANMGGIVDGKLVPRAAYLPIPPGATRPVVDQIEVAKVGEVPVGVAGIASGALRQENIKNKWSQSVGFTDGKQAVKDALAALGKHKLKPQMNVLLFQGPSADAKKVAADFPQFQAILCVGEDGAPPPLQPQAVVGKNGEKTLIIEVGQKGQHVGVLGAFQKQGGGFDFHYQLVQLGEEYNTPGPEAQAIASNKALQILEDYAKKVKDEKFLTKYPRTQHNAQIQALALNPPVELTYVASEACKACHAAEFKKWAETPHSHAMDTLVKVAKRPSLRQFDGECVKCHTVGFEYRTGAYDPQNKPAQNIALHHVGCESCHGPGSGHAADPKNKALLPLLSPWKQPGADKLPNNAFMEKVAKMSPEERNAVAIPLPQKLLENRVSQICMHCHDHEADPHFDLYKNWSKIGHSGLAPAGGWPAVAPKK